MSQTGISRLGYSCWQLVAGYVWAAAALHLPSILHNRWAVLMARVGWSTISCTNAYLTRALLAGIDHVHSNSYMNTHRPTRCPPLDKQCKSAIIISTTAICHLKDPEWTASRQQCATMPFTRLPVNSSHNQLVKWSTCHIVLVNSSHSHRQFATSWHIWANWLDTFLVTMTDYSVVKWQSVYR